MSSFLDPKLENVQPYTPGEQPQGRTYIKLNTNESPYPPAPGVQAAVAAQAAQLNLYPDPQAAALHAALASTLGVPQNCVFLGNGSDEILAFCFQGFCAGGAAFADITYGFYKVYAALYGTGANVIPLEEDFTLDAKKYHAVKETVFIANPNAPTGLALPVQALEAIACANPGRLLVVDEAYVDFGGQSAVTLTQKYANILVVGTFSKSRALAGARLGYAVGAPALVAGLERIRYSFNPYNLNRMSMAAGLAALEDPAYFGDCRQKIMQTRSEAQEKLAGLGFACTDSMANFVFASPPKVPAQALYQALKDGGILVRWFNQPRIQNHLRITVGTPQEMAQLYEAIECILSQQQS
uniref:Putative histidinolphosphate aminotransferase n=1 Tax=termite gut metagenome TaxID=433724 RepID=S0DFG9_9ZZZZ